MHLYFNSCLNISIFPILVKKVQPIEWLLTALFRVFYNAFPFQICFLVVEDNLIARTFPLIYMRFSRFQEAF